MCGTRLPLCHRDVRDEFILSLKEAITEIFSDDVFKSGKFTRIVSERHFNRLITFLEDGKIIHGGRHHSDFINH